MVATIQLMSRANQVANLLCSCTHLMFGSGNANPKLYGGHNLANAECNKPASDTPSPHHRNETLMCCHEA
jgi:hypothetical protein